MALSKAVSGRPDTLEPGIGKGHLRFFKDGRATKTVLGQSHGANREEVFMEGLRQSSRLKLSIKIAVCVFLIAAFQNTAFCESDGVELKFKQTTIFTPRGTPVKARIYSETISPVQVSRLNDQWAKAIRSHDGQVLSGATDTYNSHGYTWYMSEGGQGRLSIEKPQPYLEDGSYRKIKAHEAVKGDKVVYGDGAHSAVVADAPGWVISKWGDGPLVKHRLREMPPEFGPDLELIFYRKVLPLAPPANLRIVQIEK